MDKDQQIKQLRAKLEIAEKGLQYFAGFHIRGKEDVHLEILRTKASEFLKAIETVEGIR